MHDDAQLVARTRKGDREAFGELYDRYARLVRCVCFDGTGDLLEAQDLTQEVFFRAYRKLDRLRKADRFASWLLGIARRAVTDWQRGRARDRHQFVGSFPEPTPRDADTDADRVRELRDAIRQLPERERLALHLFYLKQEPVKVARQVLDLSRSGFYKLLDRAKRRVAITMKQTQGDDR